MSNPESEREETQAQPETAVSPKEATSPVSAKEAATGTDSPQAAASTSSKEEPATSSPAKDSTKPAGKGTAPPKKNRSSNRGKPRRDPARSKEQVPEMLKGTVTSIENDEVHVDLGTQGKGLLAQSEFAKPVQPGETFSFTRLNVQDGLWRLSRKAARLEEAWEELKVGKVVDAQVVGMNTGGLELNYGPISAFMPSSELDFHRVKDMSAFVGQTMKCEVREKNRRRKRVVLSRKSILIKEQRKVRAKALADIKEGNILEGKVEKLESFGAFVDIGNGISGLLHVSNISHHRVQNPSSVLKVGQKVRAIVIEIKEGGKRIALGMKQLEEDPWVAAKPRLMTGIILNGKVVRITEFGAFVEMERGVEGLLHRSQVAEERIDKVEDEIKVGEEITVRVQSMDVAARRLSLSRLDEQGFLLGAEDIGQVSDVVTQRVEEVPSGLNLGALLRQALEKKKDNE